MACFLVEVLNEGENTRRWILDILQHIYVYSLHCFHHYNQLNITPIPVYRLSFVFPPSPVSMPSVIIINLFVK